MRFKLGFSQEATNTIYNVGFNQGRNLKELVQLVATGTVSCTVDLVLLNKENVQKLYHLIHDRVTVNNS